MTTQDLTKLSEPELKKLKRKLEYEFSRYKNLQLAKKVQLNSAYGALGNEYFRFFDIRQAEAITMSGQLAIQWVAKDVNKYLNRLLQTQGADYVLAIDTDSIYVKLEKVVQKIFPNGHEDKQKIVTAIDKFSEEKVKGVIQESYKNLAKYLNAYKQTMNMKRENIADKAIWTAKKRYIMNVYDDADRIRYDTPDMKIMGLEAIKSSTPAVCRERIKTALKLIVTSDEKSVQDYIKQAREEFNQFRPEDISFPRTVNGLEKYRDTLSLYRKGTPIHVKGSLIYNSMLKAQGLTNKYAIIQEGEKIKFLYLKEPNPANDKVIAIPGILPEEFELKPFVDYDLQFEKAFLDPLSTILNVIGWSGEKKASLDSLFEGDDW